MTRDSLVSTAADALVGKTLEGKYEIVRILGEGGMGVVYEARHILIGRKLAIKVLHPDVATEPGVVERFYNEARIAGALGHENIIEVADMGVLDGGAPFIVMEFLEGESLAHRLEESGALPIRETVEILVPVLDALAVVHEAGVVHRDLKPDNVFLAQRAGAAGRSRTVVKLLDFGISKLKVTGVGDLHLTKTGMVLGTPYYMAPEQAAGEKDIDHRVDIYSAGVMLYEALTGARPFEGDTYNALLAAILTRSPIAPRVHRPELPEDLEKVMLRAIARDRADRFADSVAFIEALAPFAPEGMLSTQVRTRGAGRASKTSVGTPSAQARPSTTEVPAAGGRKGLWIGIAAAVAAAAIGGVLLFGGGGTSPADPGAVVAAGTADATDPAAEPSAKPDDALSSVVPASADAAILAPADALNLAAADTGASAEPDGASTPDPEAAVVPPAVPAGKITLKTEPAMMVHLDGRPLRLTPIEDLEIPAGEHELLFIHPRTGAETRETVTVAAGETLVVERDLRPAGGRPPRTSSGGRASGTTSGGTTSGGATSGGTSGTSSGGATSGGTTPPSGIDTDYPGI